VVFGAVAFIQGFQSFTGKSCALIAKSDLTLAQQRALIAHVGTVLSSGNTTGTIFPAEALFVQDVLPKLISNA